MESNPFREEEEEVKLVLPPVAARVAFASVCLDGTACRPRPCRPVPLPREGVVSSPPPSSSRRIPPCLRWLCRRMKEDTHPLLAREPQAARRLCRAARLLDPTLTDARRVADWLASVRGDASAAARWLDHVLSTVA